MEEKERKKKFDLSSYSLTEKIMMFIMLPIWALGMIYAFIKIMYIMIITLFILPLIIWGDYVENGTYFSNLFTKMEVSNIETAKLVLTWSIVPLIIGIISMVVYLCFVLFSKKKSKIPLIIGLVFIFVSLGMLFFIKYL